MYFTCTIVRIDLRASIRSSESLGLWTVLSWAQSESELPSLEQDCVCQTSPTEAHSHLHTILDSGAFNSPPKLEHDHHTITACDENCTSPNYYLQTPCKHAVGLDYTHPQLQSVHGSHPKTKTIIVPHPNSMKLTALDAIAIYQCKFNKTPGRAAQTSHLYNVSAKTVRDIWTQKTWRSATCPISNTLHHDTTGGGFEAGSSFQAGP